MPYNLNLCVFPEGQAAKGGRKICCQRPVLQSGTNGAPRPVKVRDQRPLNDQRENCGLAAYGQVITFAVWRALIKWKTAFVNGVYFFGLCRVPETSGQCHIRITTRL